MLEETEKFLWLKNRSENDFFFLICCLIEELRDQNRHLGMIYDLMEGEDDK